MKDNSGCFSNAFLILGLIALALTLTYRLGFYANYLNMDNSEVVFDWTGGEQEVWVYTDANSWVIEDEEYISWATIQNRGGKLHIYAYQNNSKEDRSSLVKIRSGLIEGIGNECYLLKVVQKGKQTSYLNPSKQSISFTARGGSESLQISTDGDSWYVTDCPSWITKSVSENTLVLRVSANNGNSSRVGIVRIKSDGIATEIKVLQKSAYGLAVNKIWIGYEDIENEGNPYFGKRLYSDHTLYLIPKIEYSCSKSGSYKLLQKLYQDGYPIEQIVQVNLQKGNHSIKLPDPDPESHYDLYYWPPGHYRYEIWYNGQCLATEHFTIY